MRGQGSMNGRVWMSHTHRHQQCVGSHCASGSNSQRRFQYTLSGCHEPQGESSTGGTSMGVCRGSCAVRNVRVIVGFACHVLLVFVLSCARPTSLLSPSIDSAIYICSNTLSRSLRHTSSRPVVYQNCLVIYFNIFHQPHTHHQHTYHFQPLCSISK